MDPSTTDALAGLFRSLGISNATGVATAIVILWLAAAPQIMPALPVADANSSLLYRIFYGVLARTTGNRGINSPVPDSGLHAGGIVPAPPITPLLSRLVTALKGDGPKPLPAPAMTDDQLAELRSLTDLIRANTPALVAPTPSVGAAAPSSAQP